MSDRDRLKEWLERAGYIKIEDREKWNMNYDLKSYVEEAFSIKLGPGLGFKYYYCKFVFDLMGTLICHEVGNV